MNEKKDRQEFNLIQQLELKDVAKSNQHLIAYTSMVITIPLILIKLLMFCCGVETMNSEDPAETVTCKIHDGLLNSLYKLLIQTAFFMFISIMLSFADYY